MKTAMSWRRLCAFELFSVLTPGCNILLALGNGAGLACVDDEDCEPSMICVDRVCVGPPDGGFDAYSDA